MIVSTFNIQNDSRSYKKNKTREIYNYLKKNKIDILGLQEVFYSCNDDLEEFIKKKYYIVGKYRYLLKLFYPIKNERNPIVSKYKIIDNKTYHLPSSKYNRIITKAVIKYKSNNISIYNTHIEIVDDNIKTKQLDKIYNIISKDNNPIILMGDFNLKNSSKLFKDFISKLNSINIKHIDIDGNTFKASKENEAIDHLFVSNKFKITKKEIYKKLDISDHYPVIIDINIDN